LKNEAVGIESRLVGATAPARPRQRVEHQVAILEKMHKIAPASSRTLR
jgi:hypothetical protein